ncbi:MAG: glycosyltransferase [Bacteroidia bacterium]|nr:glycosyltransferase [Bacteroidia bacterium]
MKLLILASRFPYPLEKGDKLRLYHQLRGLSQQHELVLAALSAHPPRAEHLAALRPYCSRIEVLPLPAWRLPLRLLGGLLRGLPAQVAYFFAPSLLPRLRQLIREEQPDGLFCQLIRMAPYAQAAGLPALIDYMDCFSAGTLRRAEQSGPLLRPLLRWEARRCGRYEAAVFPAFRAHTVISAQDLGSLPLPAQARAQVRIVSNGIDTRAFAPLPGAAAPAYAVVFVGNMGYFPNVAAARMLAREIMPLVWAQRPEARLLLAGARPAAAVRALARDARVHVSGWMPDIREAYGAGEVFAAPLFAGSGQQNKMLEALAMARPCVTTPLVNEAIGAAPGRELLVADGAPAFAQAILALLGDPARGQALGAAGRAMVEARYGWEAASRQAAAAVAGIAGIGW